MDYERARQILRSKETIEVLHGDRPVWIESLNSQNRTASVSAGGETFSVPVEELIEAYPGFKTV
ncbi:MAG: H-type small acid-soluble spore protein [Peptococcaceae bacterium]|nr:H-type small acid-soluble spore protein [Peptococcaceae bacterium]